MSNKIRDIYLNLVSKLNKRLKRNQIFKLQIFKIKEVFIVEYVDGTKTKEEISKIIDKAKVI